MLASEKRSYVEAIKNTLTIPAYFSAVILPELADYYADGYSTDFDLVPVVKCPLHTEDTPSFRYYEDTSSFYCFGCGRGGDVINLHREFMASLNGVKPAFDVSIEWLYRRFVEGRTLEVAESKEQERPLGPDGKPKKTLMDLMKADSEPKSTEVELIAYRASVVDLEGLLAADQVIALERKVTLYRAIDLINNLVNLNVIGATVAKKWLQQAKGQVLRGEELYGCGHEHYKFA